MSSAIHFLKSIHYSATERITPKFRAWEGLKTSEKVSEVVKDLFKTLLCLTLVAPLLTLCYDLIARKPLPLKEVASENPPAVLEPAVPEPAVLEPAVLEPAVPENTNSRPHSFWYGQVLVTAVTTSVFYVAQRALLTLGSESYLPLAIVGTACVIPALAGVHKFIYPIFTM